jgi:hypothetical protein
MRRIMKAKGLRDHTEKRGFRLGRFTFCALEVDERSNLA